MNKHLKTWWPVYLASVFFAYSFVYNIVKGPQVVRVVYPITTTTIPSYTVKCDPTAKVWVFQSSTGALAVFPGGKGCS